MTITENTTIEELIKDALPFEELTALIKMLCPDVLEAPGSASAASYIRSFERFKSAFSSSAALISRGHKLIYDVYSPEETALDPAKQKVQLLFYPGELGKPFVIVLPGGGYSVVATLDEGIPIALSYNALGYNAFVLNYRVGEENLRTKPVQDLAAALTFILKNSSALGVDPNDYALSGFSAGGHLAGLWCTDNHGYMNYSLPRPNALINAYALNSCSRKAIAIKYGLGTKRDLFHAARTPVLLCGKDYTTEDLEEFDISSHISAACPPAYIIHGEMDICVYCSDSELMADALDACGVPYILHLVPDTGHAFGNGENTQAQGWLSEATEFWQSQKDR
ncbi:MAG: alpha/beta hydrolase [Oscillospiraceae bacterium]